MLDRYLILVTHYILPLLNEWILPNFGVKRVPNALFTIQYPTLMQNPSSLVLWLILDSRKQDMKFTTPKYVVKRTGILAWRS